MSELQKDLEYLNGQEKRAMRHVSHDADKQSLTKLFDYLRGHATAVNAVVDELDAKGRQLDAVDLEKVREIRKGMQELNEDLNPASQSANFPMLYRKIPDIKYINIMPIRGFWKRTSANTIASDINATFPAND